VRDGSVLNLRSALGRRTVAATAVAVGVVLAAAGCNFISPQATLKQYDASDGTSVNVGDIAVRNAIALTEDGTEASLSMVVLNTGDDAVDVSFQYPTEAGQQTETVTVDGDSQVRRGTTEGDDQLLMTGLDVTVGSLIPVYVQYGTETGKTLQVPVLNGDLPEYATLLPSPATSDEPGTDSTPLPESSANPEGNDRQSDDGATQEGATPSATTAP